MSSPRCPSCGCLDTSRDLFTGEHVCDRCPARWRSVPAADGQTYQVPTIGRPRVLAESRQGQLFGGVR